MSSPGQIADNKRPLRVADSNWNRGRLLSILPVALILFVGLAAYWPVFGINFFWEDPFDIGQVEGHSLAQLLLLPNSNSYYRPLALVWAKLSLGNGLEHSTLPFHIAIIGAHLLSAMLLYGAARRWLRDQWAGVAAAALFLLYPIAFENTARAYSQHSIFTALALGVLWLYSAGRESGRRWPIMIALGLSAPAMLFHENGVLLAPMAMALEAYLFWQKRVNRMSRLPLLFFIPAILFVILWFNIPKAGEAPQLGWHPVEALYLSQDLSFPFARLIAQMTGWGLPAELQAGVAIMLTAFVLALGYGRARWPQLLLTVFWWGAATSLAWLTRPIEYLAVSPRVMYFPSFAAALAWGGLAAGDGSGQWNFRRALGGVVVILIAVQSWVTLNQTIVLYRAGSHLMDQIVAIGKNGGRLLFVNVPDRFEYRQPLYPLGYWGMLLAPVSQDLSDFVRLAIGVQMETESLSDFPLLAAMIDSSPYRVNSRGVDAHASDLLYEKILWADETYWTSYAPDGAITLKPVGDVRDSRTTAGVIGRFGETAELLSAAAEWDGRAIQLTLTWASLESARPTDTIFVHLFNADGALVGQGDGDSLNGLLPPSAWRPGNEIEDRRTIIADGPLPPGEYRIAVGLYDRASGARYPALDASGAATPDGELEAARVAVK